MRILDKVEEAGAVSEGGGGLRARGGSKKKPKKKKKKKNYGGHLDRFQRRPAEKSAGNIRHIHHERIALKLR